MNGHFVKALLLVKGIGITKEQANTFTALYFMEHRGRIHRYKESSDMMRSGELIFFEEKGV